MDLNLGSFSSKSLYVDPKLCIQLLQISTATMIDYQCSTPMPHWAHLSCIDLNFGSSSSNSPHVELLFVCLIAANCPQQLLLFIIIAGLRPIGIICLLWTPTSILFHQNHYMLTLTYVSNCCKMSTAVSVVRQYSRPAPHWDHLSFMDPNLDSFSSKSLYVDPKLCIQLLLISTATLIDY